MLARPMRYLASQVSCRGVRPAPLVAARWSGSVNTATGVVAVGSNDNSSASRPSTEPPEQQDSDGTRVICCWVAFLRRWRLTDDPATRIYCGTRHRGDISAFHKGAAIGHTLDWLS